MHQITTAEMHCYTGPVGDVPILLPVRNSVAIPALCVGVLPHGMELTLDDSLQSWVMLVREPGMLTIRGLWIDQGPVKTGPITTTVFNMTNQEVRIRKGEVVSRLLRVQGARWE